MVLGVRQVMSRLASSDYQAYLVGGCVRDYLRGEEPKDFDVATDASPEEVMALFPEATPTGLAYGTVTVSGNPKVEVTTFRTERGYADGRHPDQVVFVRTLAEDLQRRDFTVNALAMDLQGRIYDYSSGLRDLENRVIRTVGDPTARFNEDYVRMLRAVRFAARLGANLSRETADGIRRNASNVCRVSAERVRDELSRMLTGPRHVRALRLMREVGLLGVLFPDLEACASFDQKNAHHDKDVFEHILAVVEGVPNDLTMRLAALFHDVGKPRVFQIGPDGQGHFKGHAEISAEICKEVLSKYHFPKEITERVALLVKEHMIAPSMLRAGVKRLIARIGARHVGPLCALVLADIRASAPPHNFWAVRNLEKTARSILSPKVKEPVRLRDLAVSGDDILAAGYLPGPWIGRTLKRMLEHVLEHPEDNRKDVLMAKFVAGYKDEAASQDVNRD